MGKRSKDAGAEGRAEKKGKGKPAGYATVLRPVLIGAAALAALDAVLTKVL